MRRLKTVRRPPIYPKTPGHLPCSSLTHPPSAVLTPSIRVLRWIRAKEVTLRDREVTSNGLRFHYLDWVPENRRTILLLHGALQQAHS